ncbi:MAG: MBL fold metallo-hydrolase [Deltaproteobacteria bacterium]|nr:MBL fold metallo-hydrolase [Deltaproteobacteria bacterium]
MTQPRGYAEKNRFGRVLRIPTPTPEWTGLGAINSYVVLPPEGSRRGVTLIDTGMRMDASFEAMRRGFKEFGLALESIERILVTHAHGDHFGQAKRLRDLTGAQVFASAGEAERMRTGSSPAAMRGGNGAHWMRRFGMPDEVVEAKAPSGAMPSDLSEPIEVDGVLAEGDRIDLGEFTLEVVATPGHCDDHIVFIERDLGLIFSGDHLLTDISPVPLLHVPPPGQERRPSLITFMRSLAKAEALHAEATYPAHGDVIWDHKKLIAGYRLHHERRKLQIARRLGQRVMTPYELGAEIFPKYFRDPRQSFLVMSEVVGHLDLLIEDGTCAWEDDGVALRVRLVNDVHLQDQ